MNRATTGRVIAIVVTFLPEPQRFAELLRELLTQTDAILVIDNTPAWNHDAERVAMAMPEHGNQLRIARCGDNVGIGAALNIGLAAAISEGFDYILLSDQDSLPDGAMTEKLTRVMAEVKGSGRRVACVMPCYVDEVTQHRFGFQVQQRKDLFYSTCDPDQAKPWIEVVSGITSGSLYDADVFASVGTMKEEYFIDLVDTEWFHRARALGFGLFATSEAVLYHRQGDTMFPVWYLRWRPFTGYKPPRLYYRFRNIVALYSAGYVPFLWKIRAGWFWLGNIYAYLLFSPNRRRNARYIFRGLYDGIRGRMGRYDG